MWLFYGIGWLWLVVVLVVMGMMGVLGVLVE